MLCEDVVCGEVGNGVMGERSINEWIDLPSVDGGVLARLQIPLREVRAVAEDFLEADQQDGSISYWQDRFFELLEKWDKTDD